MLKFNLTLYQVRELETLFRLIHELTMSSGNSCVTVQLFKGTEGIRVVIKEGAKDG